LDECGFAQDGEFLVCANPDIEMFGKVVHNDGYGNKIAYDSNEGISHSINFESFGRALLILYRVATNDNWASTLLAAGAEDKYCPSNRGYAADHAFHYRCGSMWQAIIFFVSFGICGTIVLSNLFIAVILDTYSDNIEFEKKKLKN